jgi:F5/8 type C domain
VRGESSSLEWRAIDGVVGAAYVALAVVLTWPLLPNITTGVPADLGDPLLNAWILWWNAVNIPLTDGWWNAPAFYPMTDVLTYSEHLLGLTPLSSPVYWLSGNVQLAYNVVFLASFPLSAFFAFALCRLLTGRRDAALVGGLVFGFAPYRMSQIAHLQVLCSFWMPVTLLGLHRFLLDGQRRWLALFAGAWLMQSLSNGYFMAYLAVLAVCWVAWFVDWRDWRRVLAVAAAAVVATLPLLPIVLGYQRVHQALGISRSIGEIRLYSADLASLIDVSELLAFWHFTPPFHRAEGQLFPGLAGVILVTAGVLLGQSRREEWPLWRTRVRRGLLVATVVFGAAAVSAGVVPWAVRIAGLSLSVTRPYKPLTLALVFAVLWALSGPRVRAAARERSAMCFYVLAAALMWMLSWGPTPTWLGERVLDRGPYDWLTSLPGFDTFRVPARFFSLALVCLAAAASLGFARLAQRLSSAGAAVLTSAVVLVAVLDTWVIAFPVLQAPARMDVSPQMAREPFLLVPLGEVGADVSAMYRSIGTGATLVNGYSGHIPTWYAGLGLGLGRHDPGILRSLARRGVRQVVVDTAIEGGPEWRAYFDALPEVSRISTMGAQLLYRLPVLPPKTPSKFGDSIPIASVSASVNASRSASVLDGDISTRWDSGPKRGQETVVLDLGRPRTFAGLVLSLGPFFWDGPDGLAVDISDDGASWRDVWHGSAAAEWFEAGLQDPRRIPITLDIGTHTARYVRIRQLGADPVLYWSIAELRVFGPPGS